MMEDDPESDQDNEEHNYHLIAMATVSSETGRVAVPHRLIRSTRLGCTAQWQAKHPSAAVPSAPGS